MTVLKNHDFECEITIICDYYRRSSSKKKILKINFARIAELLFQSI